MCHLGMGVRALSQLMKSEYTHFLLVTINRYSSRIGNCCWSARGFSSTADGRFRPVGGQCGRGSTSLFLDWPSRTRPVTQESLSGSGR
jgi:hypothetical protein